jgi:hypothetical protein
VDGRHAAIVGRRADSCLAVQPPLSARSAPGTWRPSSSASSASALAGNRSQQTRRRVRRLRPYRQRPGARRAATSCPLRAHCGDAQTALRRCGPSWPTPTPLPPQHPAQVVGDGCGRSGGKEEDADIDPEGREDRVQVCPRCWPPRSHAKPASRSRSSLSRTESTTLARRSKVTSSVFVAADPTTARLRAGCSKRPCR